MKYCTNCGTPIEDDAVFCEECGTKQETFSQNQNLSNNSAQQTASYPSQAKTKKKSKAGLIAAIVIIALIIGGIAYVVKSCSTPETLEDVASEFTEAFLIDFNASKTVSLISEELKESWMEQLECSSNIELVFALNEVFEIRKEDNIGYYGDDWRATIDDVEIIDVEDDLAIVVVSVSHKGSDALWNTNIDELRVYLTREDGSWRVYDFEG